MALRGRARPTRSLTGWGPPAVRADALTDRATSLPVCRCPAPRRGRAGGPSTSSSREQGRSPASVARLVPSAVRLAARARGSLALPSAPPASAAWARTSLPPLAARTVRRAPRAGQGASPRPPRAEWARAARVGSAAWPPWRGGGVPAPAPCPLPTASPSQAGGRATGRRHRRAGQGARLGRLAWSGLWEAAAAAAWSSGEGEGGGLVPPRAAGPSVCGWRVWEGGATGRRLRARRLARPPARSECDGGYSRPPGARRVSTWAAPVPVARAPRSGSRRGGRRAVGQGLGRRSVWRV